MTCPVCGKGERGYSKMAQQSTYTVSHLACVESQREESMLMKARYQECEAELAAAISVATMARQTFDENGNGVRPLSEIEAEVRKDVRRVAGRKRG